MTFLSQVADHLITNHKENLGDVTVVFPNRRAGLFLKKHLSKKVDKPVWSPTVYSLEDFLFRYSNVKKTDTLALVFELFEAFKTHHPGSEGFESFYFWGEMLLRDFEEVDHYLVNPKQLFHHIKSDRQIAEDFYFLDEEQEKLIQKFWQEFFPSATKSQEQFVETWKILAPVYETFKERLQKNGIGYTSHIYRQLAEKIDGEQLSVKGPVIFAGFNALTPVEELLIKHFVSENQSEVLWDIDAYYLENDVQEAGGFLRQYQKDNILRKSFPETIPSAINTEKHVDVTGVSLEIGQAKAIGEQIGELLDDGVPLEEIVIILPQDYMLFPVLNAIPEQVDKLNVTMGYPLKETPLFGLLEAALEVQEHSQLSATNGLSFYHKPTLDVLSHPYLYKEEKNPLDKLIKDIKKKNQVRVFHDDIQEVGSTVLNTIFRQIKTEENYATYLQHVVEVLGQQVVERFGLEREYLYHFQQMLARLNQILAAQSTQVDLKTFKGLFRKATRSIKIPFSGEPVEGLQVMGVLETRNLDFKHVFMLNMNEDIFPAAQRNGSFVPYRIRKAFDLPTFEVQDAIYAYLFYRLFQRSERLSFYYNMYADFGMSGEVSRFIRQLEQESKLTIRRKKLSNSIQVKERLPISIDKTDDVLENLSIYTDKVSPKDQKRLSASALNVYFNCKLQFYFKYVLRLFSGDELSDELDKRNFGNVLHMALEYLYLDAIDGKPDRSITENDFFKIRNSVDGAIEKAFRKHFGMGDKRKFVLKDRNVVMADLIRKFVNKIIDLDEEYAPFSIVSLEKEDKYERTFRVQPNGSVYNIRLGADIDRVDKKDGAVRVIDYKSGKDAREIENVDKVFDTTPGTTWKKGRNKAGFQTLFYAWLYTSKHGSNDAVIPGLLNMQELFQKDFDYRLTEGGEPLTDARPHLEAFESKLGDLLKDIFSRDVPFDQTEDERTCKFCDFKGICGR
ncbi:PD-(D/E)XK nuclease superfamily protein [Ekhidna lutea]|uniref:PD-(D/E)XK nuclease superfamily protein n=1 Tax=Ekhidna lutea TaxID=447679 RepID=A0A239HRU6_EKHLU|nr:PD-(D/E)XK nuclease family protein [Ekhidna lutea]SNS83905.1 PD-(D/E)XK nuclease superfamily protein [Ekhidna lutea]